MRIALLGGTGDIGEGLTLRWAYHIDYEVVAGSCGPDKARAKADEYGTGLSSHGHDVKVDGFMSEMTTGRTSVIILAMPPYHASDAAEAVSDSLSEGGVFVAPAAGMKRDDDSSHCHLPGTGSVATLIADTAPGDVPVAGVFHNLATGRLADLGTDLGIDMLLITDDGDAKEAVRLFAGGIDNLRALDGGDLANAPGIESITPLLINVAWNNGGLHDLGIRFK